MTRRNVIDISLPHENVEKTARCKRCDSTTVAWRKNKQDKWYLVEVFRHEDEGAFSNRSWFHSQFCAAGQVNLSHADFQASITALINARAQTKVQDREAKAEENAANAAMEILALIDMSDDEKRVRLTRLEIESAAFIRNPPTMDYMVEFNRELAEQRHRTMLIGVLRAALGEIEDSEYAD